MRFLIAFFSLLLLLIPARAQNASLATGLEAWGKGDWEAARAAFTSVIEKDGLISAEVLYNLGNAHVRLGDTGQAALWYQRSLLLDPTDKATRQNLRTLRKTSSYILFEPGNLDRFAALLKNSTWRNLLSASSWAAALSLAALLFLSPPPRLRTWLWSTLVLGLVLATAAACGVWGRSTDDRLTNLWVVTSKEPTAALAAPVEGDASRTIIDLPAGSQISLLKEDGAWVYAEIPGDSVHQIASRLGWVRRDRLTRLWPWSPSLAQ